MNKLEKIIREEIRKEKKKGSIFSLEKAKMFEDLLEKAK